MMFDLLAVLAGYPINQAINTLVTDVLIEEDGTNMLEEDNTNIQEE